jgi:hypothetical protein
MEIPASLKLLTEASVQSYLTTAWQESLPDTDDAHEEGGFIVVGADGHEVVRWEQGETRRIVLPAHRGCRIDEKEIVASFHTHPHSSAGYDPYPTDTDTRSVKRDRHLKGLNYVGEFVISLDETYLIDPQGHVTSLGSTAKLLGWSEAS